VPAERSDTPPPFERIAVVGLGLIGGSIALAARALWPSALVIGIDRNEVLEEAQRAHAIDVGADDLGMAVGANLVVLAAPVLTNIDLLHQLPDVIAGDALVTDVGSTKSAIVEAARDLPSRLTFVGGHPLAGAARGGMLAASPDIFRNRPWILTPEGDAAGDALSRLHSFLRSLGAVVMTMTPPEHDRVVAWISHLPQLAASALMQVIGDAVGEEGLALSGRGLRDTTRLASSLPRVWVDVGRTNEANLTAALDAYIEVLGRLAAHLGDGEAIVEVFERAARWRTKLPE
jgi:prephenate dehydrogenase